MDGLRGEIEAEAECVSSAAAGEEEEAKGIVKRNPGREKPESIFILRRDNSEAVIKLVCHISFHY